MISFNATTNQVRNGRYTLATLHTHMEYVRNLQRFNRITTINRPAGTGMLDLHATFIQSSAHMMT